MDSKKRTQINGTIEDVIFRNEDNGYTVMQIATEDNELVTAVGLIPAAFEGEIVNLVGEWTYHKEFGKQFAFSSYEKTLPKETEGIIQYLSSRKIKGLGPVTALKIVNKYGTAAFDVIENHPEWLIDISGITLKKAAIISESFKEQSEIRNAMIFFKDYIGNAEISRVYKKLGASCVGIVTKNPYILCEDECGIPFYKADELAKSLGVSDDDEQRVLSGIKYTLKNQAAINGHTCLPLNMLADYASELLKIDREKIIESIKRFIEHSALSLFSDKHGDFVMTNEITADENFIAEKIVEQTNSLSSFSASDISAIIQEVETYMNIEYALLQREALFKCLCSGMTIITGGPGTGKTTIIKALIEIFKKLGLKTVLAAPTGRAAKRMSEATSEEAKTIHRMLEMERGENDNIRFCRNQRNPIEEKVVIIDEASMIDLSLMAAMMRAMRRGARLILIGDSDQLPSVGAGNVLADLIDSGLVTTIKLTEIFRQSQKSLIIKNSHAINKGMCPDLSSTDSDFFFVRRDRESDIADTVAKLITQRLPNAYGENIKEKIQVITPSKKGYGGVELLNKELQESINPSQKFKKEKLSHGTVFREGDRVMQVVNNYEIEWEKNGVVGYGVFNGDTGVIESIDNNGNSMNIRFDDRLAKYDFDMLDELELSYAITVHKSQGSEYPVVIIPMYSAPPMLLTRNLFYTAVTRARNMVILVGRSDIPYRMVNNDNEMLRYTVLASRLKMLK